MAYEYPFDGVEEERKKEVWGKGGIIEFNGTAIDPDNLRYDVCSRLMLYSEHGNRGHTFGWEIDHIKPKAKGGTDEPDNLQPLNWNTNNEKSDIYPWPSS